MSDADRERFRRIQVTLDRCRDLLPQRRARRVAELGPDGARIRDEKTVGGYTGWPAGRSGTMTGITLRVARALLLRCPNCGGGPVTAGWFDMAPACPRCHLRPDRGESDYFLGAIVFNMAFAEGSFAFGLLAVLLWTWPRPPWNTLYYGGILGMVLAPILFYPFSKLFWLAFDLGFRPLRPEDFEPPVASHSA